MDAVLTQARSRVDITGAKTEAMAISAVRATVEETHAVKGQNLDCVRGKLLTTGKTAAFYPGALPLDPAELLDPVHKGSESWLGEDYQFMKFSPAGFALKDGLGPPHIRLDKAVEFLIGDRL